MDITAASRLTAPKGDILTLLEMADVTHQGEEVGSIMILAMSKSPQDVATDILRLVFNVQPSSEEDGERYNVNGIIDLNLSEYSEIEAMNRFIKVTTQTKLIGTAVGIGRVDEDVKAAFYNWDHSKDELFQHEAPDNFHVIDLSKDVAKEIIKRIQKYFELHHSG